MAPETSPVPVSKVSGPGAVFAVADGHTEHDASVVRFAVVQLAKILDGNGPAGAAGGVNLGKLDRQPTERARGGGAGAEARLSRQTGGCRT